MTKQSEAPQDEITPMNELPPLDEESMTMACLLFPCGADLVSVEHWFRDHHEIAREMMARYRILQPSLYAETAPTIAPTAEAWRTIDSAPRDGTKFIGYNPLIGVRRDVSFNKDRQDFDIEFSCLSRNWTHWRHQSELPAPASRPAYDNYIKQLSRVSIWNAAIDAVLALELKESDHIPDVTKMIQGDARKALDAFRNIVRYMDTQKGPDYEGDWVKDCLLVDDALLRALTPIPRVEGLGTEKKKLQAARDLLNSAIEGIIDIEAAFIAAARIVRERM